MKFNLNHRLLFYASYQTPLTIYHYFLIFYSFSSLKQYSLLTYSFKIWGDLT